MKKLKFKVFALAAVVGMMFCGSAKAENVDLLKAKQAAANYLSATKGTKAAKLDDVHLARQIDNPTLCVPAAYFFNIPGQGYVVVSGSDAVEPILAYSVTDTLNAANMAPGLSRWMEAYAEAISAAQNNNAKASAKTKSQWDEVMESRVAPMGKDYVLLMNEKWGQGENNAPSYNMYCPVYNGSYSYAGCVAIAMAQIMHYYQFPAKGDGTASYNYNGQIIKYKFEVDSNKFNYENMPNRINANSPLVNKSACGKLCFACGVTVKMGYGVDGSGTQSSLVPDAIRTYFGYSKGARLFSRRLYTDEVWISMMHNEISAGRPIYYDGYDDTGVGGRDAGHAFVCCGHRSETSNYFYFNWGWDGGSDGFVNVAAVNGVTNLPAGYYNFRAGQGMITGFQPKTESISDLTMLDETIAYPNPASEYVNIPAGLDFNCLLTVYSADGRQVENVKVMAGTQVQTLDVRNYAAGTYIYLLNGVARKFTVSK